MVKTEKLLSCVLKNFKCFLRLVGIPHECTCSVNNSSHMCTCVWVTGLLHSARDEPEHKMHLCQSSLSRARSAHNMQMSLYKIPGSVFSHATSHLPKFWTELPQRDSEIWRRLHLLDSSVVFETGPVYSIRTLPYCFFIFGATAPSVPGPPHYQGFSITLSHTTLGRNPLDQRTARRRDLHWKHTELTRERYSRRLRDSNPQLQQNSSRRLTH